MCGLVSSELILKTNMYQSFVGGPDEITHAKNVSFVLCSLFYACVVYHSCTLFDTDVVIITTGGEVKKGFGPKLNNAA